MSLSMSWWLEAGGKPKALVLKQVNASARVECLALT